MAYVMKIRVYHIHSKARIPIMISYLQYNSDGEAPGPREVHQTVADCPRFDVFPFTLYILSP